MESGGWQASALLLHFYGSFLSLHRVYSRWVLKDRNLPEACRNVWSRSWLLMFFFAVSTGVKDAVLNALHGNYDYVEYRICFFLLIFIRFQTIIHGTSLWIKSLMLIHRVLIFLFPLTFRFLRMRLILIPLFFFHFIVVVFYMASTHLIPIQSFATVQ